MQQAQLQQQMQQLQLRQQHLQQQLSVLGSQGMQVSVLSIWVLASGGSSVLRQPDEEQAVLAQIPFNDEGVAGSATYIRSIYTYLYIYHEREL